MYVLQTNVDDDGMPVDQLTPAAIDWCKEIGAEATTLSQVKI